MSAPASTPTRTALIVAFATIYIVWGSTYLAMRVAVETMPPFAMAGARYFIAGTLLFAFLKIRGAAWPTARQWRANAVTGTFLLLGGNGLVAWAEQYIPSGLTALLLGVTPLFMVLTEWAWPGGLRPTVGMMAALLLGFGGVTWLAAPWENAAEGGLDTRGLVALAVASVSWSIGSIYSRHSKHGAEPFLASSLQMITGGTVLAATAVAHGDLARLHFAAITSRSWLGFAYLVVFGSLVGFSTYAWLIRHSTPARVSTYAYVNPIVAVFLGWLMLGEPITSRTFISSIVIVAAVAMITVLKNRASRPA